ncbi:restriction endonuclease subunit S [Samsonia erythrinae]|uniref:Type I restriction enzyme S subunit n=1 Tax=Samsonia erythrinae TaxID=160434 RepID=A0A4R3VS05_9GAMM|nr:restriction endonuclease subunit S [Samsonia erythrinae]TCV08591.1 type I restriction enzyme S subunit [Samsonia erythrinae]
MSSEMKISDMSKKKVEKQLTALRFPEFRNGTDWDIVTIGSKATKVGSGITPKGGDKNYKNEGHPFIRSQNIGWGNLLLDDVVFIDNDTHSTFSSTEIENGDVLLNITGASIGRSAVANSCIKGGNVNQHVCIIRTKKSELSPYFLNQYLLSSDGQKQIDSFQAGGNRQGLNFAQIRSFSLLLPSIKEQKKIADCLSSLDNVISLQTKKIDALQQYKKGLMQKLFPAEGATLPELRFAEFQGAPEWEERKLSEVSSSIFDGTHQTPNYKDEGIPFFSVENIVSGKENKFISENDFKISTKKNKPEKGDILLTRIGKIGYTRVVDWDYDFSIYVTLAVIKKSKSFNSFFMHYFMQSSRYQAEIHGKSLLNAVPCKTNMDSLRNTLVLLPKLDEQKRIADNFFALDELITAQRQKLDVLKAQKTGLMQQLFPAMDEAN